MDERPGFAQDCGGNSAKDTVKGRQEDFKAGRYRQKSEEIRRAAAQENKRRKNTGQEAAGRTKHGKFAFCCGGTGSY